MCNYDKTSGIFFATPATMSVIMQINANVNARTSIQNESHFWYMVVSDGAKENEKIIIIIMCEYRYADEREREREKNRIWF